MKLILIVNNLHESFDFIDFQEYNHQKGVVAFMGMSTKIKMLLAARNMTMTDLAQRLEPKTSVPNISTKLKKDNFSEADLLAIAKACDASFEGIFTLNDTGKSI